MSTVNHTASSTQEQDPDVAIYSSAPQSRPAPVAKQQQTAELPSDESQPSSDATAQAATQVQTETPQQCPIPTMGWQAVLWRIMRTFNKNATPPKLSKKEQKAQEEDRRKIEHAAFVASEELKRELAIRAEADRKVRVRTESIVELRKLSDKAPAFTVVFIGVKGASGTTTTTAHTASIHGDITRSMVVATDFNPAQGTLAARLGKDYDETTTLRELLDDLNGFANFRDFIRKIRPTEYSVRPISANDIVGDNQHLSGEDAERILDTIHVNTEHHYVDTANDITDKVTLAAVKRADVLVFTAFEGIHDSLRQLAIGMETLRKHGFGDKVASSIVVISGLKPGQNLDDYKKYTNRVNIHNEVVTRYDYENNGVFIAIPYDPVIRKDTQVNLAALDWATYQAYVDLDTLIIEQAIKTIPALS